MKISLLLETLTRQLRTETDELITCKSELIENLENAISYDLDNSEVPYQQIADNVRNALEVAKHMLYLKTMHLNEYKTSYQSLIHNTFLPEIVEMNNKIIQIKNDKISVDPNLSIDAEKLGYRMIKSLKSPNVDGLVDGFINIEIDESTSYSVPSLILNFEGYLSDLCVYCYQLLDGQIIMIQRNFNQFMNYLKDHMNRIDDILTEYSDAREAHSKLKDVYTAVHDYVSNHSDSYEFMIRYYTNLLTMTDNVRKTFDIHEKAYNLYIDPAHVHYGIL